MDLAEARLTLMPTLEETVRHLSAMERPSASEGERRAAEWIAGTLRELGCAAEVQGAPAHGTFWWPVGLANGAAALAGALAGRRGGVARRALAVGVGATAAAGIWDDVGGGSQWMRRPLRRGTTWNVVAEAGDRSAPRTAVLIAHHDAAHGGAIYDDALPEWLYEKRPQIFEENDRHPPIMALTFLGPVLVALGAALGVRAAGRLGLVLSAGTAAAMADIGRSPVVPGANDNLTAVAVLVELAQRLREEPVSGLRVLLVSTGSEESFMEGARGFVARYRGELDPAVTDMLCLESVGSPDPLLIEGEGMLRMRMYPEAARERLAAAAEEAGVAIIRGLKTVLATDALIPLRAGYRVATLATVNKLKMPSNYHKPTDTPENVRFDTLAECARVAEHWVRGLASPSPPRSPTGG